MTKNHVFPKPFAIHWPGLRDPLFEKRWSELGPLSI